MPPEAIVFTAQQCIHQNRSKGVELIEFAVTAGIHRIQRLVVAVVDGQRSTHAGQSPAHGDVQGRHRQHKRCAAKPGEKAIAEDALHAKAQPLAFKTEAERWWIALAVWRQADAIPVLQFEFFDASPSPPQAIGGVEIADQPMATASFQQCMPAADCTVVNADLQGGVTPDPVPLAQQRNGADCLILLMNRELGWPPLVRHRGASAVGSVRRWRNTPPRG